MLNFQLRMEAYPDIRNYHNGFYSYTTRMDKMQVCPQKHRSNV